MYKIYLGVIHSKNTDSDVYLYLYEYLLKYLFVAPLEFKIHC